MSLADDLQFTTSLARSAGAVARSHFGHVERLTKTHAATTDEAVTIADRLTQVEIVSAIRKAYPGDGIVGEEDESGAGITAEIPNPAGRCWVIDPIDGTNNFIAGLGNFAVCIGLLEAGQPVLGVVYDVSRDQMYAGAKGLGATLNGVPTETLATPMSSSSVFMLTSNLLDKQGRTPMWAKRLLDQTDWKIRMLGSAALEAVSVGAGIAHGAVTINGKLWDCVAPCAIVIEAGGKVSTPDGEPVFPFDLTAYAGAKVPFIATGPAAHEQVLEMMRSHP